jgi:ABC-2 type transport system ATP-binding protein
MTTKPKRRGTEIAIRAQGITKRFGSLTAVDTVSFNVRVGEVVGFLGPNGAGKTTTMRLLTGYYTPDSGTVFIQGVDTQEDERLAKQRIGYLGENNPLYGDMVVCEFLDFVADLRGIPKAERRENLERTIHETGIEEVYYRPIGQLSKGNRQRIGLAQAILHQPEVLVLDEPTEGLDPNQRVSIRDLIRSLGTERTVLLSTHVLGEIEHTCDRLLVIHRGKIAAEGTVEELSQRARKFRSIHVEIQGEEVEKAVQEISSVLDIRSRGVMGSRQRLSVTVQGDTDLRPIIFRMAKDRGWTLWEMYEESARLEDLFRELTSDQASNGREG